MATSYGVRLAAATDLPARGETAKGAKAGAYRCAARLLQPPGGLADIIATEEEIDWPELNCRSVDVREYLGRDIAEGEIDALESECRGALLDEPIVDDAEVTLEFADRSLSVEARIDGAEGPFAFVLRVSEIDGVTLRTF